MHSSPGRTPAPVREHTSYRRWVHALTERAESLDSEPYWVAQLGGDDPELGRRRLRPDSDRAGGLLVQTAMLDVSTTARLLQSGLPVFEILIAAASRMVTRWRQDRGQPTPPPLLALETHGRADALFDDMSRAGGIIDTTETVGLLSAIYPLRVDTEDPRQVRELLTAIPGDGIDYGLLRYLRGDTAEPARRVQRTAAAAELSGSRRSRRHQRTVAGSWPADRSFAAAGA